MRIPLLLGALPLGEIAAITSGSFRGGCGGFVPRYLTTNSGEVQRGDLFCALRDKRDGHAFAEEAQARGACAVLAEHPCAVRLPHLLVPSVRRALGDWAKATSRKEGLLRIGIAGSVGKTTLKDALAVLLDAAAPTHATSGNFNNALGLPLTILSAPRDTRFCLCEMGVNHRGEMRRLSEILAPHLSLITCIGHAHIGAFGSRRAIAEEKKAILAHAEQGGFFFVPAGEQLLSFLPPRGIRRIPVSPLSVEECQRNGLPDLTDDPPRALCFAFCLAVTGVLGIPRDAVERALPAALALQSRRKAVCVGSLLFLKDGYNASPESVMASLRYLSSHARGRRVAVLGDMLELGEKSFAFHRAMGRFAVRCADLLFFFGASADAYADGARAEGAAEGERGMGAPCFFTLCGDTRTLAQKIAPHLKKEDTVLFKASHELGADAIAEELEQYFS